MNRVPKSVEQQEKKKKKKVKKGKPSLVEAAPQDLKEEPKVKRGSGGLGGGGLPQDSSLPSAKHKKKKEKNVDAEQNKHSKVCAPGALRVWLQGSDASTIHCIE